MRISTANRIDGRFAVTLSPEEPGDPSPPMRDLLVDASIIGMSGDRLLAVAALAFGPHLRGVISTERPVSQAMSRAVARFQEPVFVAPSSISAEGTEFAGGGSTIVLDPLHAGYIGRNAVDRAQVIALDVLPTTTWTGRLFSMDRLSVASNASLLGASRTGAASLGPELAVAVALAHELHASRIVLPTEAPQDDAWLRRASSLLAAVGIDLLATSPDGLLGLELVDGRAR